MSLALLACVAATGACGSRAADGHALPAPRSQLVSAGEAAPPFTAADQFGAARTLAEFRGSAVVLYFYPKDATPGCTTEACAFRDRWEALRASGAEVLGVSADDVASHRQFAESHELPFPLLADPEGVIMAAYGVETTFGMARRVTFVIDRRGVVRAVFPDVDPAVHADQVLGALRQLQSID